MNDNSQCVHQIAIDQNSSAKWVYAGRDLQIVTPGGVFLGKGNVAAGGALAIQAGSLEDIGSASDARFATGATSVTVAGSATFDRAVWGGGSFSLLADTLDSRGASFYASDAAAMGALVDSVDPGQVAQIAKRFPQVLRARLVVSGEMANDQMVLQVETTETAEGLAHQLSDAIREVTKLRGEVQMVPPGTLPNDGKVIEDARSYK